MSTRDFMLLTRLPSEGVARLKGSLTRLVNDVQGVAKRVCPNVEWRAELDFGPDRQVRIFSAPDYTSAMKVSRIAHNLQLQGVRVEVTPLRAGW